MWRMMWEVKSNVMVLLCAFAEDGHEACHPFWPNNEGDTAWYGRVTVTLQSEILMANFVSRTLLLEGDQVDGHSQTVIKDAYSILLSPFRPVTKFFGVTIRANVNYWVCL